MPRGYNVNSAVSAGNRFFTKMFFVMEYKVGAFAHRWRIVTQHTF